MTNLYLTLERKCDLFNSYFVDQCTPLVNDSKLPSVLTVHTELLLESFHGDTLENHLHTLEILSRN